MIFRVCGNISPINGTYKDLLSLKLRRSAYPIPSVCMNKIAYGKMFTV